MNKEELKRNYEKACNAYLRAFCDKHDYDYELAVRDWIGGEVGGITEVGDLFVRLDDMRTDIDRDAPKEEFIKWYDYCLRLRQVTDGEQSGPNFENWLSGCYRHSDEQLDELDRLRAKIEALKQDLRDEIKAMERHE